VWWPYLLLLLQIGKAEALSLRKMVVVQLEIKVRTGAPENHKKEKRRDTTQDPPDHSSAILL
jgi:hypothetical protein